MFLGDCGHNFVWNCLDLRSQLYSSVPWVQPDEADQRVRRPSSGKSRFKSLSRYEVLVLNDLGYVQQSRDEMEVLFSLLAERDEAGA